MVDTPATRKDPFAQYARNMADDIFSGRPPNITEETPRFEVTPETAPVGIIGAGMAGLFTALMLARHRIPFQILEGSGRVGGRCYTYKFPQGGDWDYYDVGAMRFPLPKGGHIGPHQRLKKLFDDLKIPLFEYIYKKPEGIMYFNGVRSTIGDTDQRFRAKDLGVPDPYIRAGVPALCNDFIFPLAKLLLEDMETGGNEGWKILKEGYDTYSTRSYLQSAYKPSKTLQTNFGIPDEHLPTSVVNWMEAFDKSSGWYDRALTETILEALAFGAVGDEPDWFCIQHGTSRLPEATLAEVRKAAKLIKSKSMPSKLIVMNARVTEIRPTNESDKLSPLTVIAGGHKYTFSHVISTVPLPSFAFINTDKLDISVMQKNAIRQLQYGPSIKIGMLFKSAWWKACKQVGGQSFTDLPIRTIVYPSYGEGQSSKVLIASYCWTNDAGRLGNLFGTGSNKVLEDLVFRNLATVHGLTPEFIRNEHVKTYSYDWNHNQWTGGAFAFFGPGQYQYLYDAMNATAANGRLQWASELLSVRHAWIVGALDSAWAVVMKYLYLFNRTELLDDFYTQWGVNLDWVTPNTVGEHPGGGKDDPKIVPHAGNQLLKHIILRDPELVTQEQYQRFFSPNVETSSVNNQ